MRIAIYFSTFIFTLCCAFVCLRIVLFQSYKHRLFDYIDGRKVHAIQVPRLGGLAFLPALCLSAIGVSILTHFMHIDLSIEADHRSLLLAPAALLVLYLEGLLDDLKGMGFKLKFLAQFTSAILLILSGCYLTNLDGLFSINALSDWIAMPLSVFLIVGIINAVNLIDGVDGLSSSLGILALMVLSVLFGANGMVMWSILSVSALATLLVFFYFNVFGTTDKHTKIFMGDCGSQTIGLILAFLAIHATQLPLMEIGSTRLSPLLIAFGVLIVPCFDTVRVMAGRMRRGKSPFHADKTHIHHKFLSLQMSHLQTTGVIVLIAIGYLLLCIGLGLIVPLTGVVLTIIALWAAMHLWLNHYLRKKGCINYFEERAKL